MTPKNLLILLVFCALLSCGPSANTQVVEAAPQQQELPEIAGERIPELNDAYILVVNEGGDKQNSLFCILARRLTSTVKCYEIEGAHVTEDVEYEMLATLRFGGGAIGGNKGDVIAFYVGSNEIICVDPSNVHLPDCTVIDN